MYLDIVDLRAFYTERLGLIARRLIGDKLRRRWPKVAGDRLVGIGYAAPYLRQFMGEAERVMAFMPAVQGVVNWPSDALNLAALVEDDALPLSDGSIDRILAVHSLEMASNARDHLRELWRVLVPGGRLVVVVPNRRGLWARGERTPFGYGRPFSRGQLSALLRDASFSNVEWSQALAVPPLRSRFLVRNGGFWERVGCILWPAFAGVIIAEATKQLYQGIPARQRSRARPVFQPALIPPAASARSGGGPTLA
jgi:SAM-dependent methyltransferase